MKVWLICGDRYHPGAPAIEGLSRLPDITLTITEDAAAFSVASMKDFPVIVFDKSNNSSTENPEPWLTPDIQRQFAAYVEAGGGLLVTHSGTASYKDEAVFNKLIGCSFIEHPAQCPVTVTRLKNHPITQNAEAFTETDEHYFIGISDPDADIFMVTSSEHGLQPGGYTLKRGLGRVCILTPGHNTAVWCNAEYQKILGNAIRWCAGVFIN